MWGRNEERTKSYLYHRKEVNFFLIKWNIDCNEITEGIKRDGSS